MHQILWEDASWPCGDDHMTESQNRKLIRVTSSNENIKHNVRRSQWLYQIFEPNLAQNTNTTLSTRMDGQIHITWKSKMAAAAIFNFGKRSITLDWIKTLHQILWEDASQPCGDDHVTRSRNRKLILVKSSNECLEHKCLSECNRYLNQIWYRAQAPHY